MPEVHVYHSSWRRITTPPIFRPHPSLHFTMALLGLVFKGPPCDYLWYIKMLLYILHCATA